MAFSVPEQKSGSFWGLKDRVRPAVKTGRACDGTLVERLHWLMKMNPGYEVSTILDIIIPRPKKLKKHIIPSFTLSGSLPALHRAQMARLDRLWCAWR